MKIPVNTIFRVNIYISGHGLDVWEDSRSYFENISKMNNWNSEYPGRTLLCCL